MEIFRAPAQTLIVAGPVPGIGVIGELIAVLGRAVQEVRGGPEGRGGQGYVAFALAIWAINLIKYLKSTLIR